MAKKVYEEAKIAAIAEKIREKSGGDKTYTTAEMPEGVAEVYEAGKQAEWNAFWDAFQNYGKRVDYAYAFYGSGPVWGSIFSPKYDIKPTSANNMFQYSYASTIKLKEALAKNGVVIDFSKCTAMNSIFNYADVGDLPELNLTSMKSLGTMFFECRAKVIDKIILKSDGSQTLTGFVNNYASLEEVRFEGVIGSNGLNFQWATKLSHDSLVSIIDHLQDKSEDTSGTVWKVTVGSGNYAKLTEEDTAKITAKGWIFV